MLSGFADFYKAHKQDAECVCHMGYIVESHLLREMHRLGFIGDWDAPYQTVIAQWMFRLERLNQAFAFRQKCNYFSQMENGKYIWE